MLSPFATVYQGHTKRRGRRGRGKFGGQPHPAPSSPHDVNTPHSMSLSEVPRRRRGFCGNDDVTHVDAVTYAHTVHFIARALPRHDIDGVASTDPPRATRDTALDLSIRILRACQCALQRAGVASPPTALYEALCMCESHGLVHGKRELDALHRVRRLANKVRHPAPPEVVVADPPPPEAPVLLVPGMSIGCAASVPHPPPPATAYLECASDPGADDEDADALPSIAAVVYLAALCACACACVCLAWACRHRRRE